MSTGVRAGRGESIDETGERRIGGHRAEHLRLGPQHADVGQAVSAERDGQGYLQQDLARVVHRPRLAPRRQRRRYRGVQAGLADRFDQQHRPDLRDHPTAAALDTDTRVRPATLLHLESASFLAADRTLDKSHRCRSAALSTFLIKTWTVPLAKARG
jgi:hypothetical protein